MVDVTAMPLNDWIQFSDYGKLPNRKTPVEDEKQEHDLEEEECGWDGEGEQCTATKRGKTDNGVKEVVRERKHMMGVGGS